ncbi:NINE protein [Pseudolysinimonas yzui]|nr:NINE protein [Pseudolysinimonas yzui]
MSAPPGWYVDPAHPGSEHWWDGTAYTQSRPAASAASPVLYVAAPYRPPGTSPKSRTVATVLGFFLGGLGIDRFYLGNIGLGVAKLLVGWLTLGIWPFIDWIIIIAGAAHDGDGLPVVNWS